MLLLAILLPPAGMVAQKKQVLHDDQEGVRYQTQLPLSDRWTLSSDVGFRWQTGFREANQYMLRTAAGYAAGSRINLGASLGFMGSYQDGTVVSVEYRPEQEAGLSHRLWGLRLRHRLRLEERIIRTRPDGFNDAATRFYLRPRYALQLRVLQIRLSPDRPDQRLSLTVGDEVLLQVGTNYGPVLRNRILLSPSLDVSERLGFSLTLTQQSAPTATPGVFRSSEVVWLVVRHRVSASGPGQAAGSGGQVSLNPPNLRD